MVEKTNKPAASRFIRITRQAATPLRSPARPPRDRGAFDSSGCGGQGSGSDRCPAVVSMCTVAYLVSRDGCERSGPAETRSEAVMSGRTWSGTVVGGRGRSWAVALGTSRAILVRPLCDPSAIPLRSLCDPSAIPLPAPTATNHFRPAPTASQPPPTTHDRLRPNRETR